MVMYEPVNESRRLCDCKHDDVILIGGMGVTRYRVGRVSDKIICYNNITHAPTSTLIYGERCSQWVLVLFTDK
jgi:hypothetical protein